MVLFENKRYKLRARETHVGTRLTIHDGREVLFVIPRFTQELILRSNNGSYIPLSSIPKYLRLRCEKHYFPKKEVKQKLGRKEETEIQSGYAGDFSNEYAGEEPNRGRELRFNGIRVTLAEETE